MRLVYSTALLVLIVSELAWASYGAKRRMPARFRQRVANTRNSLSGGSGNRPVRSEAPANTPFLLMSTSSKLYCMRLPHDLSQIDDEKNIEIIYEEKSYSNSWITDAFYVKSEQLIYVNIYNSSSASSDIFTLKFDSPSGTWQKTVLYKDQSYCLGIGYNEQKKELYWTAAKSIMTGGSLSSKSSSSDLPFRVLFNLNMAKKLLYLKYDAMTDAIYVSTLNYVYVCPLSGESDWSSSIGDCRILVRDLVSARGLHLDPVNRYLYVVDHKRRNIKRVKLANTPETVYDPIDNDEVAPVDTVIGVDSVPDLGDTFYMTLYGDMIIWSEFSGKIKIALTNSTSSYRTVFSTTSEYAYSVSIMDNSTDAISSVKPTTEVMTTIPVDLTTQPLTTETTTSLPVVEFDNQQSIDSGIEVEVENNESKELEIGSYENQVDTTETPLYTWTRNRHTTPLEISITSTNPPTTETRTSTSRRVTTRPISTTPIPSTTILTTTTIKSSYPYEARSIIKQSSESTSTIVSSTEPKFVPKNDTLDSNDESDDMEPSPASQNSIQNLRSVNGGENKSSALSSSSNYIETDSTSLNLANRRSSSKLSLALYVVIGVLFFSLILNIILLVVSKRKHLDLTRRHHLHHREKLIIRHEICDAKSSESMPSQRSVLTSSKNSQIGANELLNECNLNLINSSNDSATSALDMEQ